MTRRNIALLFCAVPLWGSVAYFAQPGCRHYWQTSVPLIAHAGGGLPDKIYPNNLAALDLSARHGFRLIELDMQQVNGEIRFGHDQLTDLRLPVLLEWLDRHPQISIVTDFKTDNVKGLALLAKLASKQQSQFIPQIYRTEQYRPVLKLGYGAPIFSVGRHQNPNWVEWVNANQVRAVTVPLFGVRRDLRPPVFVHSAPVPLPGFGLYADCIIPEQT